MDTSFNHELYGLRFLSEDLDLLVRGGQAIGVALDDSFLTRVGAFGELMQESSGRASLTSIRSWEDVQVKHFLDSLTLVPFLQRILSADGGSLVAVGSGAGLPGIVLALTFPALLVTLLEATAKKVDFLRQAVERLHLDNAGVLSGRAEDVARLEEHRGRYDVAVARAVGSTAALVELLLPLIRVDGLALLMKTHADLEREIEEAEPALDALGGEVRGTEDLSVPGLLNDRALVIVAKVAPTPPEFPRRAGLAQRRPIKGPGGRSSRSSPADTR